MKLDVIPSSADRDPWYAGGLNFTCTQCGNCCGGAPGFVWIERADIVRIAGHLKITPEEMVERYCRKIDGRWSLNEGPGPGSDYDCVFLREEQKAARSADGTRVSVKRRYCSVYAVRPLQCRTWPFWRENLSSPKTWDHAAKRCHGMSHGPRKFTVEQIHAIRDAEEWPEHPPTSAPPRGGGVEERRGRRDKETRGQGDKGTRRQGGEQDKGTRSQGERGTTGGA